MQHTADLELLAHQLGELCLDDAALVMARLVPRIGEVQQHPVEAGIGDAIAQHFQRITSVDADVAQILRQRAIEQGADTGAMNLDTDKVLLRRCRSHQQG